MALRILADDQSALGEWQVWYDDVALTVGHTCTSTDPTAHLTLTVQQVNTTTGQPTGHSFSKDVTGDLNQGPVVDFTNVANSAVPPVVKGTIYPFTFTAAWTP